MPPAAEAFIAGQQHESWTCLPHRYEDGGFTGGNMERPALRRLLADIEAGKVDCVVVYTVELAQLAMVTQPRITQVMNLLYLAPDIQEELLFLPRITQGRDPIHEKMLRPLCAEISWRKQREMWKALHAQSIAAGC